jgi:4-diphosphocytidyl-2-C-methyl-D-erythritol kinase
MTQQDIRVFAPAKINLHLHITGKRDDGYHELESLIAFADIGDWISLKPSTAFNLQITGPFAKSFSAPERSAGPDSQNIILQALYRLAAKAQKSAPPVSITLEKNIPLASGMGGGSSNAASTIWAALKLWDIELSRPALDDLLLSLGADVPVCFHAAPALLRGIGDVVTPLSFLPEMPVVLMNPLKPCPTAGIFKSYRGGFKPESILPAHIEKAKKLLHFIRANDNDLTAAAVQMVPEITNIIQALKNTKGCQLARMTGSGATCFGLFENLPEAHMAAQTLGRENPDWWIKPGILNRVQRY